MASLGKTTVHHVLLAVIFTSGFTVRGQSVNRYDYDEVTCPLLHSDASPYSWCISLGVDNRCVGLAREISTPWTSARDLCYAWKGKLLEIDIERTQVIVAHELTAKSTEGDVWIGLNDRKEFDTWQWLGSNEDDDHIPANYLNWASGHPIKMFPNHRNEAKMVASRNWTWEDTEAHVAKTPNIACEYDCSLGTTTTADYVTQADPGQHETTTSPSLHPGISGNSEASVAAAGSWHVYIVVVAVCVIVLAIIAVTAGIVCGRRFGRRKHNGIVVMEDVGNQDNIFNQEVAYYADIDEIKMMSRKLPTPPVTENTPDFPTGKTLSDDYLTTDQCCATEPLLGACGGITDEYLTLPGKSNDMLMAEDLQQGGYLVPNALRDEPDGAQLARDDRSPGDQTDGQYLTPRDAAQRPVHVDVGNPCNSRPGNVYTSSPRSNLPPGRMDSN